MRRALFYMSENSVKLLIGAKILVIGGVLASQGFYWGEKSLTAQTGGDTQPAIAESVVTNSAEDKAEDNSRRGFLDDLLNLPKIKTDELKKEEIARYLSLIEKKRSQVEERLNLLAKREETLKGVEKVVEDKIKKLEEEVLFFSQTVQKEKKLSEDRLSQLVDFYKKMPPKKAAPVFEKLDKDLVVALFNKIPQKQTTEILGLMNPERSVALSEYFGRIRSTNEYEMLKQMNAELVKEFDACKGMPAEQPATAATP